MELKDYHKEELQILLLAVQKQWTTSLYYEGYQGDTKILKAWIDRIRLALKDK